MQSGIVWCSKESGFFLNFLEESSWIRLNNLSPNQSRIKIVFHEDTRRLIYPTYFFDSWGHFSVWRSASDWFLTTSRLSLNIQASCSTKLTTYNLGPSYFWPRLKNRIRKKKRLTGVSSSSGLTVPYYAHTPRTNRTAALALGIL